MAFLGRVSNYLWSYVSPRKTQKNRDKPYRSPPASPANTDKAFRVQQWREKQKLQALERENSLDTTELEGDTLIDTSLTDRTPASIRFSSPGADFDDANETTLVMDEDEYAYEILDGEKYFDAAAVEAYCETKAAEMRDLGWSESAIKLCLKMETKGREPLMPKTWELDFESLPEALFSANDDKVFIQSASGSNFRASLSLSKLNRVGPNVRDACNLTTQKSPETVFKKSVTEYLKWAYADAKLKITSGSTRESIGSVSSGVSSLPLVVLETGSKTVDAATLQNNALKKLIALGENWKRALRQEDSGANEYAAPLPTLYVIVATFNTVGLGAYDIDVCDDDGESLEPFLRVIKTFDFVHRGHDVWNALDIALLVVHARNEMCYLRDTIQATLGNDETEEDDEYDPDE